MSKKRSSWKDIEIVYCHLTRNLASFRYDSYLMDRSAGGCCFLAFPLLMLLNCPPNMCSTLNPLDQMHKKWILRNVLKHLWYTAHWIVLASTPLSIWTTEAPSKMTTLTSSAKSFTGGPNSTKPVRSFTTKTMSYIRHHPTPPPPPQKM